MDRRQIPLAGAEEERAAVSGVNPLTRRSCNAGRPAFAVSPIACATGVPLMQMTIAMFHEVRDAQDRVAARMIGERRGRGAVLALDEQVARDPLGAWHSLQQPFGLSRMSS